MYIMKLSSELKKIRHHIKIEEKMDMFKQMCKDLFIYPPDLTSSVPTPSTSSLVAPLSDTQLTPVKNLRANILTAEHTLENTTSKPSNGGDESKKMAPNDTAYKRWSGHKLL